MLLVCRTCPSTSSDRTKGQRKFGNLSKRGALSGVIEDGAGAMRIQKFNRADCYRLRIRKQIARGRLLFLMQLKLLASAILAKRINKRVKSDRIRCEWFVTCDFLEISSRTIQRVKWRASIHFEWHSPLIDVL